ncbi:paralemmin-1-like [Sinocyclocheilus rhinocerous]|uniref:paralemmin-1-like n=1 Tax=Sinocyclocheilus rhinocerous TaxID=307959 RepID=UPI0007B8AA22|nr:PREDICTED: paralemmin-1-like [Sinocyclocheilus rhinocerous]
MEHEAEKYQQRLKAIAEKRRIQEEQERARREIEDERLRLQQLKRKSLRDQWLMEGPPASPDSTGPRSPLWGPKVQEMETHINKLQVTSEQLAEEESKLKKLIEDGSNQTGTDAQTQHKGEVVVEPVGAGECVPPVLSLCRTCVQANHLPVCFSYTASGLSSFQT